MALNAFMLIGTAQGESKQTGYENWIEIQGWDWEVEAESSWTKGAGSSVGKPNPGKFTFEHYYDKSSPIILQFISAGKSFDKIKLRMNKTVGNAVQKESENAFFLIDMEESFITKVSQSATDEGNVVQKVELVFKKITINYRPQDQGGKLGSKFEYWWDIPVGKTNVAG
jgi:type VI secretion system secreted protein Hcp